MPMSVSDKILTGAGVERLSHDIKNYVDAQGGGGSIPMDVRDVSHIDYPETNSILIRWLDPLQSIENSDWAGTKLVRKEGSIPNSPIDGTVVVDNTTRDKYGLNGFVDTFEARYTVYYRFFPYDKNGNHYNGSFVERSGGLQLCSFANGTQAQLSSLVAAANRGEVDLYADAGWRVGDVRRVYFSGAYYVSSNGAYYYGVPSQTIDYILVDAGETSETDGLFSSTHTTLLSLTGDSRYNKDGTQRYNPLFAIAAIFRVSGGYAWDSELNAGWCFTSSSSPASIHPTTTQSASAYTCMSKILGAVNKFQNLLCYNATAKVSKYFNYAQTNTLPSDVQLAMSSGTFPYVEEILPYEKYSNNANYYSMRNMSSLTTGILEYFKTQANIPSGVFPFLNCQNDTSSRNKNFYYWKNSSFSVSTILSSTTINKFIGLFYI